MAFTPAPNVKPGDLSPVRQSFEPADIDPAELVPYDLAPVPDKKRPGMGSNVLQALKQGTVDLAIGAPLAAVDALTPNAARPWLRDTLGYDPARSQAILDNWNQGVEAEKTPEYQQAKQRVDNASGFAQSAVAALTEPEFLVPGIAQSIPGIAASIYGAGAAKAATLARGGSAASAARNAMLAAHGVEGAQTAAQNINQQRADNPDAELQRLPALASGAATGAIGYGLGKVPGLGDVESGLFGGGAKMGQGVVRKVLGGAAGEGLEEAGQSYSEQAFQNLAEGKPLVEGAAEQAGQGLALGAAMGGVMGPLGHSNGKPAGPLSKAAAASVPPATAPATAPQDGFVPAEDVDPAELRPMDDPQAVGGGHGPVSLAGAGGAAGEQQIAPEERGRILDDLQAKWNKKWNDATAMEALRRIGVGEADALGMVGRHFALLPEHVQDAMVQAVVKKASAPPEFVPLKKKQAARQVLQRNRANPEADMVAVPHPDGRNKPALRDKWAVMPRQQAQAMGLLDDGEEPAGEAVPPEVAASPGYQAAMKEWNSVPDARRGVLLGDVVGDKSGELVSAPFKSLPAGHKAALADAFTRKAEQKAQDVDALRPKGADDGVVVDVLTAWDKSWPKGARGDALRAAGLVDDKAIADLSKRAFKDLPQAIQNSIIEGLGPLVNAPVLAPQAGPGQQETSGGKTFNQAGPVVAPAGGASTATARPRIAAGTSGASVLPAFERAATPVAAEARPGAKEGVSNAQRVAEAGGGAGERLAESGQSGVLARSDGPVTAFEGSAPVPRSAAAAVQPEGREVGAGAVPVAQARAGGVGSVSSAPRPVGGVEQGPSAGSGGLDDWKAVQSFKADWDNSSPAGRSRAAEMLGVAVKDARLGFGELPEHEGEALLDAFGSMAGGGASQKTGVRKNNGEQIDDAEKGVGQNGMPALEMGGNQPGASRPKLRVAERSAVPAHSGAAGDGAGKPFGPVADAAEPVNPLGGLDEAAHAAATSPRNGLPEPSQAQKEAGNYAKGHIRIGGLDISVENPQGSTRSGVDADGRPWAVDMRHHYGYIRGTVGKDKDHVDAFIKPGTPEDYAGPVHVIDQVSPDGKFDEHKAMIGFASPQEAFDAYHANYAPGWKGAGALTTFGDVGQFKAWVKDAEKTKKPLGRVMRRGKLYQNMQHSANLPEWVRATAPEDYRGYRLYIGGGNAEKWFARRILSKPEGLGEAVGGAHASREDARAAVEKHLSGGRIGQDGPKDGAPAQGVGTPANERADKPGLTSKRPSPDGIFGLRVGDKIRITDEAGYASPGIYDVYSLGKRSVYVNNVQSGAGTSVRDFELKGKFEKVGEASRGGASRQNPKAGESHVEEKVAVDQQALPVEPQGQNQAVVPEEPAPRGEDNIHRQVGEGKGLPSARGAAAEKPEVGPDMDKVSDDPAMAALQAELYEALKEVGEAFINSNPFVMKAVQVDSAKMLPALAKTMDVAFRMGLHSFKKNARFVLAQIRKMYGDDHADALTLRQVKAAYNFMAEGKEQADSEEAVARVKSLDELKEEAKAAEVSGAVRNKATEAGRGKALGIDRWADKEKTRADVEAAVNDSLFESGVADDAGRESLAKEIVNELAKEAEAKPQGRDSVAGQPGAGGDGLVAGGGGGHSDIRGEPKPAGIWPKHNQRVFLPSRVGKALGSLSFPMTGYGVAVSGSANGQVGIDMELEGTKRKAVLWVYPVEEIIQAVEGELKPNPKEHHNERETTRNNPVEAGDRQAGAGARPAGGDNSQPLGGRLGKADAATGKGGQAVGGDQGADGAGARSGGLPGAESVGGRDRSSADVRHQPSPADVVAEPVNHTIKEDDDLGAGGAKTRYKANVAAIRLIKQLDGEGVRATPEEQAVLAKYVGWGGLKQAFDPDNEKWAKEYAELKALLSKSEYEAARASMLDAHYTSIEVVKAMWAAMRHLGVDGGVLLEPSIGTGNFIGLMPENLKDSVTVNGVELDYITGAIVKQLYPNANIAAPRGFQDVTIEPGSIDFAIGNPPFGDRPLYDKNHPELKTFSIHNFFFAKTLDKLREGGIMGMVVSHHLMDAVDSGVREHLAKNARLLGMVRLPYTAFLGNANTEVVTDIIFLQKVAGGETAKPAAAAVPFAKAKIVVEGKTYNGMEKAGLVVHQDRDDKTLWQITSKNMNARVMGGFIDRQDALDAAERFAEIVPWESVHENADFSPEHRQALADLGKAIRQNGGVVPARVGQSKEPGWLKTVQRTLKDPKTGEEFSFPVNAYYAAHPENIIGTEAASGKMRGYGNNYNVEPSADSLGAEVEARLAKTLPAKVYVRSAKPLEELTDVDGLVPEGVKEWGYFARENGTIRRRLPDLFGRPRSAPVDLGHGVTPERVKSIIGVRDAVRALMRAELSGQPDSVLADLRRALNDRYDAFQKQYGFLNSDTNRRAFRDDPDLPLLESLEPDYDKGIGAEAAKKRDMKPRKASAGKADIFTKRVLMPEAFATHVSNAHDALTASLNQRGKVDTAVMEELYGKPFDEMLPELKGIVFHNPDGSWETADDYLSGNVKFKLQQAKAAAETDGRYKANVEALEKVQPAWKDSSKIFVRLGSPWVPAKFIGDFAGHLYQSTTARAAYSPVTAKWHFDPGNGDAVLATNTYGTADYSAGELIASLLNSKPVVVKENLGTNREPKWVVNEEATDAARAKADEVAAKFKEWLWLDKDRRDELEAIFNDKYNNTRPRTYDGGHLTLPGSNPAIQLRQHQKAAVWRAIQDRIILLDHVVGAGKTYEMAAIAMEMRRLGLVRKPMFLVPKHLIRQWRDEFYKLYPNARVLAATEADFDKQNRKRLMARIATGDWDAVVVGHTSFKKIGMPPETEQKYLQEQIQELADSIEDMKRQRGDRNIIRDMEGIKLRLEARIKALADTGKKDDTVTFDELGVDGLFVDEAHLFKNLFFYTQMSNVAGLGSPKGSQRAFDLFIKIRYLQDRFADKGTTVFATGTPVSNSLVEMYTMQRYLQWAEMKRKGIHLLDAWAGTFGDVQNVYEVHPSGTGYRLKERFQKFANLPGLMEMYKSFADSVTLDDLKQQAKDEGKVFPVPKIKGGKPNLVVAKRSEEQKRFFGVPEFQRDRGGAIAFKYPADLQVKRDDKDGKYYVSDTEGRYKYAGPFETEAEAKEQIDPMLREPLTGYNAGSVLWKFENLKRLNKETNGKVNALSITNEARKAGLDFRIIDPNAPDHKTSKVNQAVANVLRVYKAWDKDKGAQLVFCDLSVPKSAAAKAATKEQDVWVRDGEGLKQVKATVFAPKGYEGFVFYIQHNKGKTAADSGYVVYDAISGAHTGIAEHGKKEATDAILSALERSPETFVEQREQVGELTDDVIADWKADNAQEDGEDEGGEEGNDKLSRDDLLALSGGAGFSVYDDIRRKLVAKGVPESEVAFIHDYDTAAKKGELFAAVRRGDVRVLLGSTERMGAGMNVQERLVALHHLDAPWRPSDLEQREGRIVRQGNALYRRDPEGFEIEIHRYGTEQTYDTRMWQILEHKANGVQQLRQADENTLELEDIGGEAANAADMKAATSGNPLILEEIRLRNEVKSLEGQEYGHRQAVIKAQNDAHWAEGARGRGNKEIAGIRRFLDVAERNPVSKDKFAVQVGGKAFTDRKEAGAAFVSRLTKLAVDYAKRKESAKDYQEMGEYRGLPVWADLSDFTNGDIVADFYLTQPGASPKEFGRRRALGSYNLSKDEFSFNGLLRRADNNIAAMADEIRQIEADTEKAVASVPRLRELAVQPFGKAEELTEARRKHRAVMSQLQKAGGGVELTPEMRRELDEAIAARTGVKFSQADSRYPAGSTVAAVREALRAEFGKKFEALERRGLVSVLPDGAALQEVDSLAGPRTKAMFKDGKVYLAAANIAPGREVGVFLHEAGVHGSLRDYIGKGWDRLVADYHRLVDSGDPAARRAEDQIQALRDAGQMPEEYADEERIAYLVEYVEGLDAQARHGLSARVRRFVARVIRAIRAALYASPYGQWLRQHGFELTAQDFAALARAAVMRADDFGGGADRVEARESRRDDAARDTDVAYLAAVERGDMETAQAMVVRAAKAAGVPVLDEDGVTAYRVRRTAPPRNTAKAYKLFRVKKKQPGEVFALFVGAEDPLPQGVWLDAIPGPAANDSKTGRPKVQSKLGALAYRPGWHAGDVPLATHIGAKNEGGDVFARKDDEVWAEVEVADDDQKWKDMARQNGTKPDGSFSVALADVKEMPVNGMYRYKTNPNMTGEWIIAGAMKINRILGESEVNAILRQHDMPIMPWAHRPRGSKVWQASNLDLGKWGLVTNPARNQKKLLDPVTRDDNGNVIPLSRRFDLSSDDPRYSQADLNPLDPNAAPEFERRLKDMTFADAKKIPATWLKGVRSLGLQTMGRQQLTEVYADDVPELRSYNRLMMAYGADGNKTQQEAGELANEWGGLERAESDTLADIMHYSTVHDVDAAAKDYGQKWTPETAEEDFEQEYRSVKDEYERLLRMIRAANRGEVREKARWREDFKVLERRYKRLGRPWARRGWIKRRLKEDAARKAAWFHVRGELLKLSDKAQNIYESARDMYQQHWDNVRQALEDRINRSGAPEDERRRIIDRMRNAFAKEVPGVYFPLHRAGEYVVVVKNPPDADGVITTDAVMFAEALGEAERLREGLLEEYKGTDKQVMPVTKKKAYTAQDAVSGRFVGEVLGLFGDEEKDSRLMNQLREQVTQLYLEHLPDLSWAKHEIRRKKTPGYSRDARRAFAAHMTHGAAHLARIRYADRLEQSLERMQEQVDERKYSEGFDAVRAQEVVNEMKKRHELAMNPPNTPLANFLTSAGFVWFMGLSPASAIINISQTPMVAWPVLGARYGLRNAAKALASASKDAVAALAGGDGRLFKSEKELMDALRNRLSADEFNAIKRGIEEGHVSVTLAHDLAGVAQGQEANPVVGNAMRAASWMFHQAEMFNRIATVLAAYRMGKDKGLDAGAAYDAAIELNYKAHFDYSATNRPRVMAGPVARVMLLFKQYAQNMIYLIARNGIEALAASGDWMAGRPISEKRREAAKLIGGLLATHGLMAGALGLPFATTLLAMASALGSDDDDPWDAEVALRNFLADVFGERPAEAMVHGLPRLARDVLPGDISSRVGLDHLLLPDVQEGLEGDAWYQAAATAALGPVVGIGLNAAKGVETIANGQLGRGLEEMMPKVLRDALKAGRYASEGVKDKTGVEILGDTSLGEELAQLGGFAPARVMEAYESRGAVYNLDRRLTRRRAELVGDWAKARMAEDQDATRDAVDAIKAWNAAQPDMRINRKSLVQSYKARARRVAEAKGGVYLPRKRDGLREEGRFFGGD